MAVDRKINYEMQGDEKPARNYLGKQKTVTVPVKWKSGPKTPVIIFYIKTCWITIIIHLKPYFLFTEKYRALTCRGYKR